MLIGDKRLLKTSGLWLYNILIVDFILYFFYFSQQQFQKVWENATEKFFQPVFKLVLYLSCTAQDLAIFLHFVWIPVLTFSVSVILGIIGFQCGWNECPHWKPKRFISWNCIFIYGRCLSHWILRSIHSDFPCAIFHPDMTTWMRTLTNKTLFKIFQNWDYSFGPKRPIFHHFEALNWNSLWSQWDFNEKVPCPVEISLWN